MEPFVVLAFFPLFYAHFCQILRRIPVFRPTAVLLGFPLVLQASGLFVGLGGQMYHLSFSTPTMALLTLKKTLRFKGKMSNFDATSTLKLGKKTPKGQMAPVHTCTGEGLGEGVRIIWGPKNSSNSKESSEAFPRIC